MPKAVWVPFLDAAVSFLLVAGFTHWKRAIAKIGISKKKFNFCCQRHALSTSFGIFVVTERVTNFLPKLVDIALFFYGIN